MAKKISNIQVLSSAINDVPVDLKDAVEAAIKAESAASLAGLSIQDQHNIYLKTVYNKYAKQVIFDVMGGWVDGLTKMFLRDSSETGEFTELLAVNNDPAKNKLNYQLDDGHGNDPFGVYLPDVLESVIAITDEVQWVQTITRAEMRKAFINEYGLIDSLEGLIVNAINKKADIYMFNRTKEMLSKVKYEIALPNVANEEDAKKCYEIILSTNSALATPQTHYNEKGAYATTNLGEADLILTNEKKAKFDVRIVASLFNSDKINLGNMFKDYFSTNINEYDTFTTVNSEGERGELIATTTKKHFRDENVIGYLLDRDALRQEIYLTDTLSILNPKNLSTNFFHTVMVKSGLIPFLNALKLTNRVVDPVIIVDSKKMVTLDTNTRNAVIYYTTDGSEPSKEKGTLYTGEPFDGTSHTVKAKAFCDEAGLESKTVQKVIE